MPNEQSFGEAEQNGAASFLKGGERDDNQRNFIVVDPLSRCYFRHSRPCVEEVIAFW